ncbi:MAG: hypothetical protein K1X83_13350 [Oligoflexia bacterium]|nr:hypothetical protein [Oligoflexia bacterium]
MGNNLSKAGRSLAGSIEVERSGQSESYPYCKIPPHYFDRMLQIAAGRRSQGFHLSVAKWSNERQ